jgi:hypothetical protein
MYKLLSGVLSLSGVFGDCGQVKRGTKMRSFREHLKGVFLRGSYGWTVLYLGWAALEVLAHVGQRHNFFFVIFWAIAAILGVRWCVQTSSRIDRLGWNRTWVLVLATPWLATFSFAGYQMWTPVWLSMAAVAASQTWFLYRLQQLQSSI